MISGEFSNPFRQFRAEQFDENLWSYYVSDPFDNLLGGKPLVVEGGRGSGKTMFFLCNSWREQRFSIIPNSDSVQPLLDASRHIGIYYRVDTPFITSLIGGDIAEPIWSGVFATYLSTCLLRELVDFLLECERVSLVREPQLAPFFSRIADLLQLSEQPSSLSSLRAELLRMLDHIERLANNPVSTEWRHGTIPGRLIGEAIAALRTVTPFSNVRFHIFIDEYESLLEYQQRQINSLIKHSTAKLVYNIGLRPNGMRTTLTTSDTEQIQDPHDYKRFRPESALSPDGQDTRRLESVLAQICKKRLQNAGVIPKHLDADWLEIRHYLGSYDVDDELASFKVHNERTIEALRTAIRRDITDEQLVEEYVRQLGLDTTPWNARLHVCLLQRASQFRPSPTELVDEFLKWSTDRSSAKRYSDWLNNMKVGLVFLLSHEYRRAKRYSGVDIYAMLSSGIIRYFIELCEQAFDFAHANGFTWNAPRKITHEEQTRAARYVSKYKVNDIERYPMGVQLRQLTMSLGTIFQALHQNKSTTLGEPEVNHFAVNIDELAADSSGVRRLLDEAVLWAVLQTRPSTKDKEVEKKADTVDYHLNHIYCPYFGISYRQKRKIELQVADLAKLSGTESNAVRNALRGILVRHKIAPDEDHGDTPPEGPQLTLLGARS